jgi:hypothetical protein
MNDEIILNKVKNKIQGDISYKISLIVKKFKIKEEDISEEKITEIANDLINLAILNITQSEINKINLEDNQEKK